MWPVGGVGASFSGPFTRNLGLASLAPNKVVGPSVRRNTAFGSRLLQRHRMFNDIGCFCPSFQVLDSRICVFEYLTI